MGRHHQVLLHLLGDSNQFWQWPHWHGNSCTLVRAHFRYPEDRDSTTTHLGYPHPYLLHIDNVIVLLQGRSDFHTQVFNGMVWVLKSLFPYLEYKVKELLSIKRLRVGEGEWTCIKEFIGWVMETKSGTVTLPYHKCRNILNILDLPSSKHFMRWKCLDQLISNTFSIHLVVIVVVANFYNIHCTLE